MHVQNVHRHSHSELQSGLRKRCARLQPYLASISNVSPASLDS